MNKKITCLLIISLSVSISPWTMAGGHKATKNSSKIKKMQQKIQQQNDEISLLKLKLLESRQGGSHTVNSNYQRQQPRNTHTHFPQAISYP